MTRTLRGTHFSWDPETESRSAVWNRIKHHVQQELDRIHVATARERQLARRRASPTYARNRQIMRAWQQGMSDCDLARQHGLTPQYVRELVRREADWYARHDPGDATLRDEHPAWHGSAVELDAMPTASSRTMTVIRDP